MLMVSSLWWIALTSDRFYVERRQRFPFASVLVVRRTHDRFEWLDCDIADLSSVPRLLFSCDLEAGQKFFPPGFIYASARNAVLALSAGSDVRRFSLLTRKWTPVSKTIPPSCKLVVATLENRVVVVESDGGGSISDDDDVSSLHSTVCEVYDVGNDRWDSVWGLPEALLCDLCFTCQGNFFVRGQDQSPLDCVYVLDPAKNRWEEDVEMRNRLAHVPHSSKVVARPDGTLLAAMRDSHNSLVLKQQQVGKIEWITVIKFYLKSRSSFSLLQKNKQIVLVIPDTKSNGLSCRIQPVSHFHGLICIYVASQELTLATLIDG